MIHKYMKNMLMKIKMNKLMFKNKKKMKRQLYLLKKIKKKEL